MANSCGVLREEEYIPMYPDLLTDQNAINYMCETTSIFKVNEIHLQMRNNNS